MKIRPSLKNHSDTESETSTSEVEVADGSQAAEVGEAQDEHRAEAEPHRQAVEPLAAERALAAAGHRPSHLRAGPRVLHEPGEVVHAPEHDLPGVSRPRLHGPVPVLLVVLALGDEALARIAGDPGADAVLVEEDLHRALLGQPGRGNRRLGLRYGDGRQQLRGATASPTRARFTSQ